MTTTWPPRPDYCTKRGAETLAARIIAYWRDRGCPSIRCTVERGEGPGWPENPEIYRVRIHGLVNALPDAGVPDGSANGGFSGPSLFATCDPDHPLFDPQRKCVRESDNPAFWSESIAAMKARAKR